MDGRLRNNYTGKTQSSAASQKQLYSVTLWSPQWTLFLLVCPVQVVTRAPPHIYLGLASQSS